MNATTTTTTTTFVPPLGLSTTTMRRTVFPPLSSVVGICERDSANGASYHLSCLMLYLIEGKYIISFCEQRRAILTWR
jgi:hypothetical protein